ncbi:MAG: 1-acyl-sn-glycerol-3-phosphate acyltransferase [Anaerolineae bacterium]|nr:1-acyl-sn-glycerol-3-phosphate acyltransferase [Anaerolineae bacterium]
MTNDNPNHIRYPRHRLRRFVLRQLTRPAFALLTEIHISGAENVPDKGPLLVVGNHFSFIDPVAVLRIARWPLEFMAGAHPPYAPTLSLFIPGLWDVLPLYRGTGSTYAIKNAAAVLKQGGVLGIFPEGGNWAEVLRPARPGAAFLASLTGAPLLPVGLHGLNDVFPLRLGKRARVTINIGKLFGPFRATGHGRERRVQLDEIGHEIMRHIADLIPPEKRGHYSDDPAVRAAAQGTEVYPWADKVEGEILREVH